jgi:hypothetical protein
MQAAKLPAKSADPPFEVAARGNLIVGPEDGAAPGHGG